MSRLSQFFEDSTKALSMGRLNSFQVIAGGGVIIAIMLAMGKDITNMFYAWLGAGTGHGIVSKASDAFGKEAAPDVEEDATP